MARHLLFWLACGLMMLFFDANLWAKPMYVRSARTDLLQMPKHKSTKLAMIKRGTKVEQLEKQGRWIKISFESKEGWVPSLVLSNKPIRRRVSLLAQKTDISSKARRRASVYSSTAAARGLTDSGRKRVSDIGSPNYEALRNIESMKIDEVAAIQFLSQ